MNPKGRSKGEETTSLRVATIARPASGAAMGKTSCALHVMQESLARFGGNQTYAGRDLGMSRNTLLARMDALGITRPRKKPPVP